MAAEREEAAPADDDVMDAFLATLTRRARKDELAAQAEAIAAAPSAAKRELIERARKEKAAAKRRRFGERPKGPARAGHYATACAAGTVGIVHRQAGRRGSHRSSACADESVTQIESRYGKSLLAGW